MGIFGLDVTIVVDVANVMGSRPDGWWRDRAGAAVRLHDQIAQLAASGRAILPGDDQASGTGDQPSGTGAQPSGTGAQPSGTGAQPSGTPAGLAFVLVLEGAARAAIPRLKSSRPAADASLHPGEADAPLQPGAADAPLHPGEVRVVEARGSGDDTIVAVVHELPGRRVVVTADRELRARCVAAGAEILGPGWLLGLLEDTRGTPSPKGRPHG